jgi:alginate O-acetyltransferase complex protein AlgI
LFKKVVIADFLAANFIDRVYDDPAGYSSAEAWLAALGYCWQLYADFSGYTDIARGSAKLFGFELPENFARPYRSTGPIQFWRSWHMTLGRWVQDYLYIPLGGSRRGRLRTYVNLFVCFVIIGVWHGAGWTFLLFGLWQAVGVTANRIWRDLRGVTEAPALGPRTAALCAANFLFVMAGWTFFRAASVGQLAALWRQMVLAGEWWPIRVGLWSWAILLGMPLVHLTPPAWVDRARDAFARLPAFAQAVVILAVGALVIHVGSRQPAPFIYFQF